MTRHCSELNVHSITKVHEKLDFFLKYEKHVVIQISKNRHLLEKLIEKKQEHNKL